MDRYQHTPDRPIEERASVPQPIAHHVRHLRCPARKASPQSLEHGGWLLRGRPIVTMRIGKTSISIFKILPPDTLVIPPRKF
jgi:hypothetical protein